MDGIPIIYGKDVNTGAISQLKSVSNVLLTNSGSLDNLTDVVISSASTGQSLTYNGTNWVNTSKAYLTLNIYGSSKSALYSTSSTTAPYQKVLILNPVFWQSSMTPDVSGGYIEIMGDLSYNRMTGNITGLNSSKTYRIDAIVNLNGINLSSSARWDCAITKNTLDISGSSQVVVFTRTHQHLDYAGITMNLNYFITGTTIISLENRMLATTNGSAIDAIPVANTIDSNFSITVQEL